MSESIMFRLIFQKRIGFAITLDWQWKEMWLHIPLFTIIFDWHGKAAFEFINEWRIWRSEP